jgi:hypothetical protein
MLLRVSCRGLSTQARCYSTNATRAVPTLTDATLETFRKHAFEPALPALLPQGCQMHIPAMTKWFKQPSEKSKATRLDTQYLSGFKGASLPLEITNNGEFVRIQNSLALFLEFVNASESTYMLPSQPHVANRSSAATNGTGRPDSPSSAHTIPTARIYIAQASLADLPTAMRADLPTPELVLKAGKGDIYDSSIWMGQAPTYTPLHRDPNPNLFVQLAGKKVVRLYEPRAGNAVFSKVQEAIGRSGSATMRGEEMMQGREKELLEEEVWSDGEDTIGGAWQAELNAGDALFIPKGWWHSVKGLGDGMNGSVNWWFR